MTLEFIPSRLAAIRNEYSLSIRSALYREIPELILPHFNNAFRIELRTLYQEGNAIRHQWIFRDARGMTRVTAAGRGSLFAERNSRPLPEEEDDEDKSSGIIELRNSQGDVIREFQYNEDLSEWDFRYFYRDGVLIRAEIWFKEAPAPAVSAEPEDYEDIDALEQTNETQSPRVVSPPAPAVEPVFTLRFTDLYRYTRSGSLRAVDRRLHAGALEILRIGFPRLGPGVSLGEDLITHGGAYTAEHFVGVQSSEGVIISYSFDTRGRIQGEVWRGDDGEVLGELVNTWTGDRLHTVSWVTDGDERFIEFEYDDDGNRIAERNFRNGVLERSVITQNGMEVEELYIDGRLVLRAFWEDGVKISEERITPARARP
jgi:YD repeat-containing protein